MDPIEDLEADHRRVQDLLSQIERGSADVESGVVDSIVRELSVHAAAEEAVIYPVANEVIPGSENLVGTHLQEHQLVKELLVEIERGGRQDRKLLLASLAAYLRHHVHEEETRLFPLLRQHTSAEVLGELGAKLDQAKKAAPTHPHPHAPNTPPLNAPAGAVASLLDRVRDAISSDKG